MLGRVLQVLLHFADYECVLDHNQQPMPYSKLSELQINEEGKVQWDSGSENEKTELPPGAQRYVHIQ